jgi:exodeoxyribonuclease VII small subunit
MRKSITAVHESIAATEPAFGLGRSKARNSELQKKGLRMPRPSAAKPIAGLTYETAFAELQAIVSALEAEPGSLDEAMSLFERGQALVKRCQQLLAAAEIKIKRLSGEALAEFEED